MSGTKTKEAVAVDDDKRPKPKERKQHRTRDWYYDLLSGGFFARNNYGEYQEFPRTDFRNFLRDKGFWAGKTEDGSLNPLDQELLRVIMEESVQYAGSIGGFQPGYYDICGSRVLVTSGPKFLVPKEGEFPHLDKYLKSLLGDQLKYFLGWVKSALASLKAGLDWSPGQLLAIAGPRGSGKSMLQSLLTLILGGRVSSPYDYMVGKTHFNKDVFSAEHGLIGDQNHKTDYASRRAFGAAIKTLVVNREQYIHGKGKTAVTLMPFLRLSLTLNDNPEALSVLPPLDADVGDKVLLLKATEVQFPFPSKEFPTPQDYMSRLRSELPAFLHWLRGWRIPESIRDSRYGVVSYHHHELVSSLYDLSPEQRLWQLIETYIFKDDFVGEWVGTSSDLQALLEERCKGRETRTVLPYSSACGQYLSKLAHRFGAEAAAEGEGVLPEVVVRDGGKNRKIFTIRPMKIHP